jgi:hypothetical protein
MDKSPKGLMIQIIRLLCHFDAAASSDKENFFKGVTKSLGSLSRFAT